MAVNMIVSAAFIQELFGISSTTLGRWRAAGCPCETYGKYHLKKVLDWWSENIADLSGSPSCPADQGDPLYQAKLRYMQEQGRKRAAEADVAEAEVARQRGDLIPRAEVVKDVVSKVHYLRHSLKALSLRLPPICEKRSAADIHRIVDSEVELFWRHIEKQELLNPDVIELPYRDLFSPPKKKEEPLNTLRRFDCPAMGVPVPAGFCFDMVESEFLDDCRRCIHRKTAEKCWQHDLWYPLETRRKQRPKKMRATWPRSFKRFREICDERGIE